MLMKKVLTGLLAAVVLITAAASNIIYGIAEETPTSGKCGENSEWFINSDATLVISGDGTVEIKSKPWNLYSNDIQRIVIEHGIVSFSNANCFSSCKNLKEAVFSSTVTNLNSCLQRGMSELKDVWIYAKEMGNTFESAKAGYPQAGSGTKWHIYQNSTTEKSLRDGLSLTDDDIDYITEEQKFPEIENRTPIELPEVTDTSGPAGLNCKYTYDKETKILTISGVGSMFSNLSVDQWGYYKYKDEITEVVIEEGITSIDVSAFGPFDKGFTLYRDPPIYSKLTKLTLPSSVKSIGDFAFYKTALTSIEFSEGLEEIGDGVFAYTSLSGDLNLPKSLNEIGDRAFYHTNISSVNLNEGMIFGGSAFRDCDFIKEVTIPKDLRYVMSDTSNAGRSNDGFAQCDSLEKVIIKGGGTLEKYGGNMEKGVGENLFYQCPSLKEIIIDCDNIEYVSKNSLEGQAFDMTNNPKFYIYKGSTTEQTLKDAGYLNDENTVYIADFSKLETAISEAEGIETEKYTEESVSALNEAIENSRAVLEDLTSSQDEVDNAVKAVKEAKNALEEKKADPSDPSESDPTNSSDNNNQSQSPNTPATPAPTTAKPKPTTPPTVKTPAKVKTVKLKAKKKKLKVSWKKVSGAVGYEVQASTKKNFKKNAINKATAKNKVVIKKLKSKKKYFVRVRAYATYKDAKGKMQKVYSKWVKFKKKVKVK